ncbi:hypothetical protein OKW76_11680 [Sphingomonas sp. S1-29]|uniref:hypothetical protein n=1 Tax=Sphingomonas sp. S1-29 TaxID=2991074 RepID=UPI00224063BA|nr:hypothetical protein [Sphingomonas sp. S1-29]UZK68700.1 hypothetical protein OKW76_11680 [Sphingomonas sp. S1-29]
MEDVGASGRARRPSRLPRVARRFRPLVSILWWAWLGVALTAMLGGSWLGWVNARDVAPAFSRAGLSFTQEDAGVEVSAMTPEARRAGPTWPAIIVAIEGKSMAGEDARRVARALDGPAGKVRLTVDDDVVAPMTIALERGAAVQRRAVGSESPFVLFLLETAIGLVAVIAMTVCAVLLFRRRRDETVALLLSLAFLTATALISGSEVWRALGLPDPDFALAMIFLGLMMVVIPAFPDGELQSRWGAWIAYAAAPLTLVLLLEPLGAELSVLTSLLIVFVLAVVPYRRFRRAPRGIERQQLKWAAFGFTGALVLLLLATFVTIALEFNTLPASWEFGAFLISQSLLVLAFVALAIGPTISILRISLWDADAAIGKSAGAGAVTVALGGIWTASTILTNDVTAALLGGENKALAAGASAVIAASVLGPAQRRVSDWIDRRFSAPVLALRALPDELRRWQDSDTPADIGRRVIAVVAEEVGAAHVAMLLWQGDGFEAVASRGVTEPQIDAWVEHRVGDDGDVNAIAPGDALFALRIELTDGELPIGLLLIGGRPEGAGLAKDVRAALDDLRAPVAAALRRAYRAELRDTTLLGHVRALDDRLARLELGPARAA